MERLQQKENSFYTLPLHRCLSFFISNYVYFNILHSIKQGNTGALIRRCLQELFQISTESEYDEFIIQCLLPVLKSIGFFLEAYSGKWINHGESIDALLKLYGSKCLSIARYDLSLCSLLLSSYSAPNEKLISFIFDSLSQNDEWLSTYLEILANKDISSAKIDEYLETEGINRKKVSSILEQSLFFLAGLCSNDCLAFPFILKSLKGKYAKCEYHKQIAEQMENLKHHAMKKEIVHGYFKCKSPWVTFPMLSEKIPKYCKEFLQKKENLAEIFTISKEKSSTTESYNLKQEYYSMYDPYYYSLQGNIEAADEKAENIFKKIEKPSVLNPLFGNAWKNDNNLDIGQSISQVLGTSGLGKLLLTIIENGIKDQVSDNTKIYSLKLLKCIKKYLPKETEGKIQAVVPKLIQVLVDRMKHFEKVFNDYQLEYSSHQAEENKQISTEKAQEMKLKREKIMEEFKRKSASFAERHVEALVRVHSDNIQEQSITCAVCNDVLTESKFVNQPYGKLISLSFTSVLLNYFKQNTPEEAWQFFDKPHQIQTAGLIIQSCGHYMHHQCLLGLLKQKETDTEQEEAKLLGRFGVDTHASLKDACPLCKTQFDYIVPVYNLTGKINIKAKITKKKKKPWTLFKGLIEVILKKLKEKAKDKEDAYFQLIQIFSKIACYWVRLNQIKEELQANKHLILSVFYVMRAIILFNLDQANLDLLMGSSKRKTIKHIMLCSKRPMVEHDYLIKLTRWLVLTKLKAETDGMDKIILFTLFFHVWQSIMKLFYQNELKGKDKSQVIGQINEKTMTEFIEKNKNEIKKLSFPWLINANCIKDMLCSEENNNELIGILGKSQEDHEKFDIFVSSIGHKTDFLEEILKGNNKSSFSPDISFDLSNIIDIIKRNIIEQKVEQMPIQLQILNPIQRFHFVHLEENYMDLQKIHYKRKCKKCGKQVKNNALCLLCGEILCVRSFCCMYESKGELSWHSGNCSTGDGIFLYFARNVIIIIHGALAIEYKSPYTNQYGESVNVSKEISFEPIMLNHTLLNELKQIYMNGKILNTIRMQQQEGKYPLTNYNV